MSSSIDLDQYEPLQVRSGIRYRNAELTVRAASDGGKQYEFVCSSEAPVDCRWMYDEAADRYVYGTEILLHGIENVDMSWISSGNAPFLKDHDTDDQVGVILGAELRDRTLIVTDLKFSRSQDGIDIQNDIDDGIRKNVSIGYVIEQIVEVQAPRGASPGIYHVTRWKPYEVSSVSIPAVEEVGFGRSQEKNFDCIIYRKKEEQKPNQGERVMEPEIVTGGNQNPAPVVIETESHASQIAAQAEAARHLCPTVGDLAARAIAEGITAKEFYEKRLAPAIVAEQERQATVQIGMSAKDKQRFSLVKLVRYMSEDKSIRKDDVQLELEASEAYCSARGISAQRGGIVVPHEAIPMKRAAITSSANGAGVVEEIHSGEVIDYLRETAVLARAGARFISGLVGKYDMARIGVGTSAYWVGEKVESDSDITTSALDLDLLQFTLKTVGVNQGITRQMMRQTSLDVEGIVRGDIYASLADAIDLAGLAGTGASNQPTGLMYTSGVGTESFTTAQTPLFANVVNMETAVAVAKALRGSCSYIAHPTLVGLMKQTLKASNVSGYVAEDGQINGYPFFSSTNAIKSSTKAIIFGNFAELMVGMWGGLELVADPYTYSRKGIVSLTAFQDVDVQLRHPASFVYTSN